MVRVALVGLGSIAKIHLPILLNMRNVELCAVCDTNRERKGLAPDVPFYTDYLQMMDQVQPDCVHLCLPHWLHYPVAKAAIERGIHVFTEKPLALDLEQAQAFAKLEMEHAQIKVGLCLQNRYNATTEALKQIIRSGDYGKVESITGLVLWSRPKSYYDAEPWRGKMATAGGGVMINQGIHTLDLMTYLCGKVTSLKGSITQLLEYGVEVEDTASARMSFVNGTVGHFYATVANGENSNVEISVAMEKGSFLITDDVLYQVVGTKRIPLAENTRMDGEKFYYGTSHAKLISLFYEDLEKGTCRYPNAWEGVSSMALIDAICRSSESGKAVTL